MQKHIVVTKAVEDHYLETGKWLSIAKVKETGQKVNDKVGTENAKVILEYLKGKYQAGENQYMNAFAAMAEKDVEEVKSEVEILAHSKDVSRMTKHELCIAVCALVPLRYSEIKDYKRDKLRKIVVERRRRQKGYELLRTLNMEV